MKIDDTKNIEQIVQRQFKKNPNRRLSACFRQLRKQKRFDLRGDYPLIANILTGIYKIGITPSRKQIAYMMNQSTELKTLSKGRKTELLNQLLELSSVVSKEPKFAYKQKKIAKMTHTLSQKGNK
jgi:hypothetical protein